MYQQSIELSGHIVLKPERRISMHSLAQLWPRSVPDGKGGVVVAWLKYSGNRIEIYAQRTDEAGQLRWGSNGLRVGVAGTQTHPSVVSDELTHTFFVSWTKKTSTGSAIVIAAISQRGIRVWQREL